MKKHLSREMFTRQFLLLVSRLSEGDIATLGNGWAGGWRIQSQEEHERMMTWMMDLGKRAIEPHAKRAERMLKSPTYKRNQVIELLRAAGRSDGEIADDLKMKRRTVQKLRQRAGKPSGRKVETK